MSLMYGNAGNLRTVYPRRKYLQFSARLKIYETEQINAFTRSLRSVIRTGEHFFFWLRNRDRSILVAWILRTYH
ncbi:hypothetical protein CS542_06250 [Pedobacter sp. IW39]|nr:hypothetical protein CS542_06250 [Pedobacter sp. IW39]